VIARPQRNEGNWTLRAQRQGTDRHHEGYKCSTVASDTVSRFHGRWLILDLVRKLILSGSFVPW
jgi:hypothetical protein